MRREWGTIRRVAQREKGRGVESRPRSSKDDATEESGDVGGRAGSIYTRPRRKKIRPPELGFLDGMRFFTSLAMTRNIEIAVPTRDLIADWLKNDQHLLTH